MKRDNTSILPIARTCSWKWDKLSSEEKEQNIRCLCENECPVLRRKKEEKKIAGQERRKRANMQKTLYFCDVCHEETKKETMYTVAMAIHKDNDVPISVRLDTCTKCVKQTGFEPDRGRSYNNNLTVERNFNIWSRWFGKRKTQ